MLEETEIVRAPDGALIKELSLVLNSVSIPHRVIGNQHQSWIVVPEQLARRALEELSNYHRENVGRKRRVDKLALYDGALNHALIWCVSIAIFHVLSQSGALGFNWRSLGMVDGARIAAGEWWRPITALTLHADLTHLFSNLFFGAVLIALLVQMIGPSLSWFTVLCSGTLGNLLNVWISGAEHRSLGASTAVFSALGVLTAIQFSRKLASSRAKMTRFVPLVAGALLLAWNGMGKTHLGPALEVQRDPTDNTDIGAHIAGWVCGLILGLIAWRLESLDRISPTARHAITVATPVILLVAWGLALASYSA